MLTFDEKVAVVTGGASGIGYALAEAFLSAGARVVIADVEKGSLDEAAKRLSRSGEVMPVVTDVSDPSALENLATRTVEKFGRVNILCNNAGVGGLQTFEHTTRRMWEWTLGVDLWGVIDGCRIFLPLLRQQDEAHIVNTASMSGLVYGPYIAPYNVAKAGVIALTETLRGEFSETGCKVGISVLCPGFVATCISDDERNAPKDVERRSDAAPQLEEARRSAVAMTAGGTTPAQVAAITLEAIKENRLHIFPHPEWLAAVDSRTKDILAGHIA